MCLVPWTLRDARCQVIQWRRYRDTWLWHTYPSTGVSPVGEQGYSVCVMFPLYLSAERPAKG